MPDYRIIEDDLQGAEVIDLLAFHLADMHALSPVCHAMPVGRLREIDATRGELKSMRATPAYRGKGAGKAILLKLIEEARRRGYTWLGLETGSLEAWGPARALYRKHGFAECPEFGDYVANAFSLCMSRTL